MSLAGFMAMEHWPCEPLSLCCHLHVWGEVSHAQSIWHALDCLIGQMRQNLNQLKGLVFGQDSETVSKQPS